MPFGQVLRAMVNRYSPQRGASGFFPGGGVRAAQLMDQETLTCQVLELRKRPVNLLLSPREHQIMSLIGEGLNCSEIARTLRLSPATVRNHVSDIYRLLGVRDRLGALAALRLASRPVRT
jgi:DNA-binding NarL/FixJ family response regulator